MPEGLRQRVGMVDDDVPEGIAEGVWLPIPDAARRLRVTPQAIRGRIGRGTLEAREERRGNRARTLVRLPANVPEPAAEAVSEGAPEPIPERDDMVAGLREHVVRLEEQLAAAERVAAERARFEEEVRAELRRTVEQQRADLDRERHRAEEAERRQADQDRRLDEALRRLGELQEQARRQPWPGLRRWWRRFVEGG